MDHTLRLFYALTRGLFPCLCITSPARDCKVSFFYYIVRCLQYPISLSSSMKLYKKGGLVYIDHAGLCYATEADWDRLVNRANLFEKLLNELSSFTPVSEIDISLPFDPPIQGQEVWAAGVT